MDLRKYYALVSKNKKGPSDNSLLRIKLVNKNQRKYNRAYL